MSCGLEAVSLYLASIVLFLTLSSSAPSLKAAAAGTSKLKATAPAELVIEETGLQSMFDPVLNKINGQAPSDGIIVVGIAGGSGSGKTTLARAIYGAVGENAVTYIAHDSYYKDLSHLSMEERDGRNFDHPGALDTHLLVEHLKDLKQGKNVSIPQYDFNTHTRINNTTHVPARPIILVEGILIFADIALYEQFDIKIFVDTADDIRLIRRILRDTTERGRTLNSVIEQYLGTVRPMHLQFVETSKRNADIIVPVGMNAVAVDLVVSKLQARLAQSSSR